MKTNGFIEKILRKKGKIIQKGREISVDDFDFRLAWNNSAQISFCDGYGTYKTPHIDILENAPHWAKTILYRLPVKENLMYLRDAIKIAHAHGKWEDNIPLLLFHEINVVTGRVVVKKEGNLRKISDYGDGNYIDLGYLNINRTYDIKFDKKNSWDIWESHVDIRSSVPPTWNIVKKVQVPENKIKEVIAHQVKLKFNINDKRPKR